MGNYDKLISLLNKWPANSSRIGRDYSAYLRTIVGDTLKNKRPTLGDYNSKSLISLQNIIENKHYEKYAIDMKHGATGLPISELNTILDDDAIKKFNTSRFKW